MTEYPYWGHGACTECENGSHWCLCYSDNYAPCLDCVEMLLTKLRGDLVLYGQHQPGCLWHERNHVDECDCGWDEARKKTQVEMGEGGEA